MVNKIKLKDRLKSWLVTLGIASVFGLAALGVNAANSYQKASAYVYQDNGTLIFSNDEKTLLANFIYAIFPSSDNGDGQYEYYFEGSYLLKYNDNFYQFNDVTLTTDSGNFHQLYFSDTEGDNYLSYLFDTDTWNLDEGVLLGDSAVSNLVQSFNFQPYGSDYQSLLNYALSYNIPQSSGNFVSALTDFMSLIGGGIVDLAQSIGAGVVSFASGLFLDSGHLSILGGIIGIFAGIALAVGITSKVYTWVSTLGN